MRTTLLLSALLIGRVALADIQCSPTTPKGSQARTKVKHRTNSTGSAATTTVPAMIGWNVPDLSNSAVRRSNTPLEGEERTITLTGSLWRVKLEDNDCDLHLEMSNSGASDAAPRVIVEIPQENAALRNRLIKAVKDAGLGDLAGKPSLDFGAPLPITVTGLAFVDATHWNKNSPKKGKEHGTAAVATLWELHPIFDFVAGPAQPSAPVAAAAHDVLPHALPRPDHIVVVIEENKGFDDVIDAAGTPLNKSRAKYINGTLVKSGALLTSSFALHHPSQPNYLDLFSGSSQGVCNDDVPAAFGFTAPNLATRLRDAHANEAAPFIGYAESLPQDLTTPGPTPDQYARKHCPWLDFANVPKTFTKDTNDFPATFGDLPRVAFVIPNLFGDMHSVAKKQPNMSEGDKLAAEVRQGDTWLSDHLEAYRQWAMTHNSLLIVTFDEDSSHYPSVDHQCNHPHPTQPTDNRIATIIVGEHVRPGAQSSTTVTHHGLLRTILDLEGLPAVGASANAQPITDIWQ